MKQYNILFISALSAELKVVKQEIKKLDFKIIKPSFLIIWMWNYETISSLTKYLEENKPDFIVNIWVCGYKTEKKNIIQIARVYNLSNKRELLVPVFFKFSDLESTACSEVPVFDSELLWDENFVDMESYWVEFVINKYKIPRIILKVPVDKVWEETKNFDYKKALKLLEKNIDYEKLVVSIIKYLDKIPEKINLEKYYNYFKMTVSEKFIFERLYNKYNTIKKWNFEDFFEENKELGKKEFLNKYK